MEAGESSLTLTHSHMENPIVAHLRSAYRRLLWQPHHVVAAGANGGGSSCIIKDESMCTALISKRLSELLELCAHKGSDVLWGLEDQPPFLLRTNVKRGNSDDLN